MQLTNKQKVLLFVIIIVSVASFLTLIKSGKVLDTKTLSVQTPVPTPSEIAAFKTITPTPNVLNSPSPSPKLLKNSYTIALFGDSMIDTMGDMKYLNDALTKKYPETKFNLYNYGIGAQNVQKGLDRLSSPFSYMDREYPPLKDINADIIIFGTFAYNPFEYHDIARYTNTLTNLFDQTKSFNKNIYLLIEIAPLGDKFGLGPHGINWPPDLTIKQSQRIDEQLSAAREVAKNLQVPIVDIYSHTKKTTIYTNVDDGIHPSYDGAVLTANLIAKTIIIK